MKKIAEIIDDRKRGFSVYLLNKKEATNGDRILVKLFDFRKKQSWQFAVREWEALSLIGGIAEALVAKSVDRFRRSAR